MRIYRPCELNAMSLEERKVALESEFGRSIHVSAAEHVTWIFRARDSGGGRGTSYSLAQD
jgi:hypothetical protein